MAAHADLVEGAEGNFDVEEGKKEGGKLNRRFTSLALANA